MNQEMKLAVLIDAERKLTERGCHSVVQLAADELAHLRTWTGRFRPSPSSSRTSS